MIVGADTRVKSTLVTPTGQLVTLKTVTLSPEQAKTLRAFKRDIEQAVRLRFNRGCIECGRATRGRRVNPDPMEWEVNNEFIALACDCTMFAYGGQSVLPESTPMRALPIGEGLLVDADGNLLPRHEQRFTTEQARLLRDYDARVLRPLGIVESPYCQVCEDHPQLKAGVRFRIGPNRIECVCHHALRTYEGSTL